MIELPIRWLNPHVSGGFSHERCECLVPGFDPKDLADAFAQFHGAIRQRALGRDVWFRAFRFDLERTFERNDLTLVAVARFTRQL
jgi:hypothetical protein